MREADTSIVRRGVTSVAWNVVASVIQLAVWFVRATLLARWLPVEVFGVFALAGTLVSLTSVGAAFGLGSAFLHPARETADEGQAAAVHFTLRLIFTVSWAALLIAGALLFTSGGFRTALVLLTVATGATLLAETPRLVLIRRVRHERLALIQALNAFTSTAVALGLAWHGFTLGALLAAELATAMLTIAALYLWRPVCRLRLALSPRLVRHLLSFGARNMLANTLQIALERLDRLWTGYYLGTTPLGFYSRAHAFAGFARTVSSGSVSAVAGGIFAELIGSRRRLSQAFSRTVALVVRGGFLLGGLVLVVTPEFIRLVLGPKWLPMLDVLRLAVVFAMIEPVRTLAVILFVVLGRPQTVVRLQLLQLTALLPGLFVLGLPLGASGVALALDAALLLGTVIGLRHARTHVDFSPWRLFAAPAMALVAGLTLGGLAGTVPAVGGSDWRSAAVKATVYCALYGAILGTLERQRVSELVAAFTDCMTAGGARQPSGLAAPDA